MYQLDSPVLGYIVNFSSGGLFPSVHGPVLLSVHFALSGIVFFPLQNVIYVMAVASQPTFSAITVLQTSSH